MNSPDPPGRGLGRRAILKYTAAGAMGVSARGFAQTGALAAAQFPVLGCGVDEAAELQQLYREALDEGGGLVVWAGGSVPTQEERTRQEFINAFPGIDIAITVRYSTEHSAHIDRQLILGGLEPDIVQLQTLQDFDYWKARNALLPYRPPGAEAVFTEYRDPDDTYIGIGVPSFGRVSNSALLSESEAPRDAVDFLAPAFRDKIVIPDPIADDAILFAFYLVTQKAGLQFMERFMEQRPLVVANAPAVTAALASGQRTASLASIASLAPIPGLPVRYLVPRTDPFMSWPRTAAIFRESRHPAAAKLYLAWQLTVDRQRSFLQWPSRRDVAPPPGWSSISEYNSPINGFREFMRDRAAVERYRALLGTFFTPSVASI